MNMRMYSNENKSRRIIPRNRNKIKNDRITIFHKSLFSRESIKIRVKGRKNLFEYISFLLNYSTSIYKLWLN